MTYIVQDKTAIHDKEGPMIIRILPVCCSKKKAHEITKLLCKAMNQSEDGASS